MCPRLLEHPVLEQFSNILLVGLVEDTSLFSHHYFGIKIRFKEVDTLRCNVGTAHEAIVTSSLEAICLPKVHYQKRQLPHNYSHDFDKQNFRVEQNYFLSAPNF